jgi:hypothetical protein
VRVVIGGPGGPRRSGGIPWWLIVGGVGFLVFGGWKGFFGAIAGVILIPVALVIFFALGFFVWSIYLAKKHGKNFKQRSPFEFERRQEEDPSRHSTVIESEATVVRSEDER